MTKSTESTGKISVRPVTAHIGASVSGVDLASDLSDQEIARVRSLLLEHKVLFFRDQHRLTPESQVRLGRRFGELEVHPFLPAVEGFEEVTVIAADGRSAVEETWHADVTFRECPAMGSILRAVDVPDYGRDTLWADMEAVYEGLSSRMQRMLDGMTAIHHWNANPSQNRFEETAEERGSLGDDRRRYQPVEHPVIRTHPETGRKCVFVNQGFTVELKDVPPRENRAILSYLYGEVRMPEYQVRLHWEPGTVAFWDNRCTQHAVVWDRPYDRVMHRVTIVGDRPY